MLSQLDRNMAILEKYIPAEAAKLIAGWIPVFDFKLKIRNSRLSKFGDYRAPLRNANHQITVNRDLNTYAFLVTLVHEIAHLSCFQKHQDNVKPHGKEWKHEFRVLMQPFLKMNILPSDVDEALRQYLQDPAASSCSDPLLYRTLKKYDKPKENTALLEELPAQTLFSHGKNRYFIKGKKLRTRYYCIEYGTRREYLFSALTEVKIVSPSLFKE